MRSPNFLSQVVAVTIRDVGLATIRNDGRDRDTSHNDDHDRV
jgi:hypothetical protein